MVIYSSIERERWNRRPLHLAELLSDLQHMCREPVNRLFVHVGRVARSDDKQPQTLASEVCCTIRCAVFRRTLPGFS